MSFEMSELLSGKRRVQEKNFIELTDEELLASFADDVAFVDALKVKQQEAKVKYLEQSREIVSPASSENISWKEQWKRKLEEAESLEELDQFTKEIVRKNKQPKQPKKKLMRVENFYQRHMQGLQWMTQFLERTKPSATSRPFVERMLALENEFKSKIENDDLLGPHLEKD